MSPIDFPEHKEEAAAIVAVVATIKEIIEKEGFGTVAVMTILGELMKLASSTTKFNGLPHDQRDEFFAEVWDFAIGDEKSALINKVGMFEGEHLEAITDGMKGAALAYFNKEVPVTP